MTSTSSKWEAVFYTNARGDCPPLDFINNLRVKDRAKVLKIVEHLEEVGVLIRMPHAKHLDGHLWELRPLPYRLIYFAHVGRKFIILHAFRIGLWTKSTFGGFKAISRHENTIYGGICCFVQSPIRKKGRKTRPQDIAVAKRRMEEIIAREE